MAAVDKPPSALHPQGVGRSCSSACSLDVRQIETLLPSEQKRPAFRKAGKNTYPVKVVQKPPDARRLRRACRDAYSQRTLASARWNNAADGGLSTTVVI